MVFTMMIKMVEFGGQRFCGAIDAMSLAQDSKFSVLHYSREVYLLQEIMTVSDYILISDRKTVPGHPLYRHRQSGKFYGGLVRSNGMIYYPVDIEGNPIDPPTESYGSVETQFVSSLDPTVVGDIPMLPTRCYALANEDSEDLLNHPQGIDWV